MEEEVFVPRGALSMALHLSRIFGSAPIELKKVRYGYKISISRTYVFYSYFVAIVLNLFGICCYVMDIDTFFQTRTFTRSRLSENELFTLHCIAAVINLIVGCFCSKNRMKQTIKHLIILDKVKKQMDQSCKFFGKENKKVEKIKTIVFLGLIFILTILNCSLFIYYISNIALKGTFGLYIATLYFCYIIEILVHIQIGLILLEVFTVLQMLNRELRHLVDCVETEVNWGSLIGRVCQLNHGYVSACEVSAMINKDEGLYSFLLFISSSVINIVFVGYNLTEKIYHDNMPQQAYFLATQVLWIIFYFIKVIFIVEPCHLLTEEVRRLQRRLTKLMLRSTSAGDQVPIEMEIMCKETLLMEPVFSPLGVYKVDRTFILTTCGVITTYMVFIIQLQFHFEKK